MTPGVTPTPRGAQRMPGRVGRMPDHSGLRLPHLPRSFVPKRPGRDWRPVSAWRPGSTPHRAA